MTLSDFSIKKPVFAWMLMFGLILFGWIGFRGMGISQLPDVDFPIVNVSITWEGGAPEVVETEVTDIVEDAVMQVQGIKEVTSSSKQGQSSVTIEFNLGRDIDVALQEVQTKIAQAQRNLPKEIDPPVITKTNPEDNPIIWLGLSGTGNKDLRFLMEYARNHLKDKFTTVSGVGEVIFGGYVEPNLRVWLDANKMQQNELTVNDVISAIQSQHAELPAGYIDTMKQELNVRVMGEAGTTKEFENIIIPQRSGERIWSKIRLKDVASIEDGLADIRRISRVSGEPAIGLGIKKQRGSNEVAVARAVKKKMEEVQKELPEGLQIGVNFDRSRFVETSTEEMKHHLIVAAILTSIVCWAFLGSWSSALNIILAIPTSIVGAFFFMNLMGFTLNTFTLLGLTLVIGIVVDDAIMVLENIVRYRELKFSRVKSALVGAREITGAALAASIAILAIFAPVVFIKGAIGTFFFQFGMTISIAVMLSLLEALTLAPMRCSQFLEVGHASFVGNQFNKLMDKSTKVYSRLLDTCLNYRWWIISASVVFFIGSLSFGKILKKEFVPAQDQGNLLIRLQTPIGSSIEFTNEVFKVAEKRVSEQPEIRRYYAAIGGFGGGEVNTGVMFITLYEKGKRPKRPDSKAVLSQQELMPILRKTLSSVPGVEKVSIQDLSLSGFTARRGFPVEFTLLGSNWIKLGEINDNLKAKLNESGFMVDVDSDYLLGQPELRVVPDREKSAQRGVSVSEIGNTINAMIGGVRSGKYSKDGRRYDIRVRLAEGDRSTPEDVGKIWVRNNQGEVIRLKDVVKITENKTLLSITRKNRERAINFFANVAPGKSQSEALEAVQKVTKDILPEGYRVEFSGSAQTFKESFSSLNFALIIGIVVAYMVLASQYNSFIHPITVLVALPFSITGAFIALWLGGRSINLYSMIGILLLMGIVKKNSILLVDFTNEKRKLGLKVREALEEACPIRLRPIIMTSVSTVVAAIPSALAVGEGSESTIPMALVIIGGVIVSTLLTLFVVPCVYSVLSPLESHKHDKDLKEALRELGESATATEKA